MQWQCLDGNEGGIVIAFVATNNNDDNNNEQLLVADGRLYEVCQESKTKPCRLSYETMAAIELMDFDEQERRLSHNAKAMEEDQLLFGQDGQTTGLAHRKTWEKVIHPDP